MPLLQGRSWAIAKDAICQRFREHDFFVAHVQQLFHLGQALHHLFRLFLGKIHDVLN